MFDAAKILDRIYQGFVLRDILGFVAPGSISLISLWIMFHSKVQGMSEIVRLWRKLPEVWQTIAFLVFAYLLGWILQSMHFAVLKLLNSVPLLGGRLFDKKFGLNALANSSKGLEGIDTCLQSSDVVTRGALEPDLVLAKSMNEEQLSKRVDGFLYTERLSALMLMTGNLSIAGILSTLMLATRNGCVAIVTFAISILLYIEFWRLWQARNLQVGIYALAFKQKKARVS